MNLMNLMRDFNMCDLPVLRRYTFALYPNKKQSEQLDRQAVLHCQLWNAALQEREDCFRKTGKSLSFYDQSKGLKFVRNDDPEYKVLSSHSMQSTIENLDKAFKAFFSKLKKGMSWNESGYPKYKSSELADTIPFRKQAWKMTKSNGCSWKIYIQGVEGLITARGKFPINPIDFRTMNLMKRNGKWQMSIACSMPVRRTIGENVVSIDFDLIDTIANISGYPTDGFSETKDVNHAKESIGYTKSGSERDGRALCSVPSTSSGSESLDSERDGRATWDEIDFGYDSESLDLSQSKMDTRYKRFSYRWKKARAALSKQQSKIARKRNHDLHVWTTQLSKSAMELSITHPPIAENIKTGRGDSNSWGAAVKTVALLNRHILNQAPSSAIAMLKYKAEEAGIKLEITVTSGDKLSIGQDIKHATKTLRQSRKAA